MAAFVCKNCNATLVPPAEGGNVTCPFCGAMNTLEQRTAPPNDGNIQMGFYYLGKGDFPSASTYFTTALRQSPESGLAWIGALCVKGKARRVEDLLNATTPLDSMPEYEKAIEYSGDTLKGQLQEYNQVTTERRRKLTYEALVAKLEEPAELAEETPEAYQALSEQYKEMALAFEGLANYKDAPEHAHTCHERYESCLKRVQKLHRHHHLDKAHNAILLAVAALAVAALTFFLCIKW